MGLKVRWTFILTLPLTLISSSTFLNLNSTIVDWGKNACQSGWEEVNEILYKKHMAQCLAFRSHTIKAISHLFLYLHFPCEPCEEKQPFRNYSLSPCSPKELRRDGRSYPSLLCRSKCGLLLLRA
jgi:hypothetical protein